MAACGKACGKRTWLALLGFLSCSGSEAAFTFENVRSEEITANRAVIRFDTSVPTTCEVMYGTAPDALSARAEDPSMAEDELALEHEVPLEGLQPSTTYYFRPRGTDAEGNTELGAVGRFDTGVGTAPDLGPNAAASASVTTVSSNFGGAANDETWGILSAFDGDLATAWSSNGDGNDAYFVLDFGQPTTLTSVAIRSRYMTDGTSIVTSFTLTADDGTVLGPFQTLDHTQRYTFPIRVTTQTLGFDVATSTGGNTGLLDFHLAL